MERERVSVKIGTQVIDHLGMKMAKEELQQTGNNTNQVHLSTVISKRNTVESLNIPKYNLEGMKGKIHTIREAVIPLFTTFMVKGIANLMMHSNA